MKRSLTWLFALGACASTTAPDPGLEGLALTQVAPQTVIPGSTLQLTGNSFVTSEWGSATLHLVGQGNSGPIDVTWPATFSSFTAMTVAIDTSSLAAVGGDTDFHGTAEVDFVSTTDGKTYSSAPLTTALSFRTQLTPVPTMVATGVIFVNDQIEIDGDGFLLGGGEGNSYARVNGCFQPDAGGDCTAIAQQDIAMVPMDPLSRTKAAFPFAPEIVGIEPGTFTGTVQVINKQMVGAEVDASPLTAGYTLVTSQVFSADPPAASLGQYVFVHGGGFVGGETGALTQLELQGTFSKTGGLTGPVDMTLIPEFVEGRLVRYIINTDDALGQALDLRHDTGSFTGTITPIVSFGSDTVRGVSTQISFALAPVRQVVYLEYEPAYTEELRDYGLRAVDAQIRATILSVCQAAYAGVNMDFRTDPPTDFALFSNVDIVGVDPNNMGLFGYDNSPGKDSGNLRLYDELGGVNATTQQDGFPGFGGVFVRSFMAFSQHPGEFATSADEADPAFDQIFDPFRPDQGGNAITSEDLTSAPAVLTDGSSCPGTSRHDQVACAIYVLGNLVGDTLAHEIGHSLGLANPYQDGFHDAGDLPNRLMDAGGDRPFLERATLAGQGPGLFCTDEYSYLQGILPSTMPAPNVQRPTCN